MTPPVHYTLSRPHAGPVAAPALDAFQRSVVDHPGGPLLVLAGPGTGKTTTLVEAIVDRIEGRGASPDEVLALTFSRKAAEQLRDRVTARLGRTMATTLSSTFHSFAYGVVRRYAPAHLYRAPLRLLSAPEQDVILAELLSDVPDAVRWPASLRPAVATRGFAREDHAVLARARERGLEPDDLRALGEREGVEAYVAAGAFMRQYLDNLDDQSAIDYADLISRAVVEAERHRDELRARFRHVFVDEYQDTDPSQVRLLRALAGDGRDLVVVGDPDQSIYGFRGAEVRGILDFPRAFPTAAGAPAPVTALSLTRRFGPRLLAASRRIASSIAVSGSIPADRFQAFREPTSVATGHGPGVVEVRTYDTARAETEHIADALRRAHLEDDIPWGEMAVLVRSGRASIPALRRSLGAAGVPVEVASDDTPLVREPAVRPLVEALAVCVHAGITDAEHPDYVGVDRAADMLVSPLAGLDATDVRALARQLRARDKATAERPGPREPAERLSSPELLRQSLLDPDRLAGLPGRGAERVGRLGGLLREARATLADGGTAEEVLWVLWSGTDWPRRLRAGVDAGGTAARLAHRDLDALCALFEVAARAEEQRGHTSVESFLATLRAQQIPADTLAEQGVRGDAVRLLTAHRSKGLEWRFTVVAQVQEGGWPDLRRRGSLLQADRIAADGLLPPLTTATLLAEERRLFYVACTRARQRLLVTAVRSPEDDGDQPSRFLEELGVPIAGVVGRPRRPLSLSGLVADLRRTVADPAVAEPLRVAAARRLAQLVLAGVPQADPATWWGLRAPSRADTPVRPAHEPLRLSASALEGLLACPARWFLQREAGGAEMSTAKQGFGSVVHAIANRIAKGELDSGADLMPYVDQVWGQMVFRTPWAEGRERVQVQATLDRFVAWHNRPGARVALGTETHLECEVTLPDGQVVRLDGYADRLELDEEGRVVVVDLKTGKYAPTKDEVTQHAQLGLYQLAVDHGAADALAAGPVRSGGAELVQLRLGDGMPKVQAQDPQQPGADGVTLVQHQLMQAAAAVRSEEFVARAGKHCDHCSFHPICPAKTSGTVLS